MYRYVPLILSAFLVACVDKQTETAAQAGTAVKPATGFTRPGGAIVPQAVTMAEIPDSLRLPGQLLEGLRWPDANGENLLVVFRTVTLSRQQRTAKKLPVAAPPDSRAVLDTRSLVRSAQLTARQYVRRQGRYIELWRLQDFVRDCALGLTLRLVPGSTAITDLDHDGRSETTLLYALACQGDASSATLKLIMRAGPAKYALRGFTVVQQGPVPAAGHLPATPCCLGKLSEDRRDNEDLGGYYQTEAGFRAAPAAFLPFARRHWQKFSVEKMDERENL